MVVDYCSSSPVNTSRILSRNLVVVSNPFSSGKKQGICEIGIMKRETGNRDGEGEGICYRAWEWCGLWDDELRKDPHTTPTVLTHMASENQSLLQQEAGSNQLLIGGHGMVHIEIGSVIICDRE